MVLRLTISRCVILNNNQCMSLLTLANLNDFIIIIIIIIILIIIIIIIIIIIQASRGNHYPVGTN